MFFCFFSLTFFFGGVGLWFFFENVCTLTFFKIRITHFKQHFELTDLCTLVPLCKKVHFCDWGTLQVPNWSRYKDFDPWFMHHPCSSTHPASLSHFDQLLWTAVIWLYWYHSIIRCILANLERCTLKTDRDIRKFRHLIHAPPMLFYPPSKFEAIIDNA